MCFDHDSHPPIEPIAGGSIAHANLELTAADGTRFMAFSADAANPTGAGIIVLPDVRGLHRYYEELTLRFAEAGIDAIAIDFYGRSAGIGDRGEGFDFMPHVAATTWARLRARCARRGGPPAHRAWGPGALLHRLLLRWSAGARPARPSASWRSTA